MCQPFLGLICACSTTLCQILPCMLLDFYLFTRGTDDEEEDDEEQEQEVNEEGVSPPMNSSSAHLFLTDDTTLVGLLKIAIAPRSVSAPIPYTHPRHAAHIRTPHSPSHDTPSSSRVALAHPTACLSVPPRVMASTKEASYGLLEVLCHACGSLRAWCDDCVTPTGLSGAWCDDCVMPT
eukprot:9089663-Pyramimonas_sp.AAC.1